MVVGTTPEARGAGPAAASTEPAPKTLRTPLETGPPTPQVPPVSLRMPYRNTDPAGSDGMKLAHATDKFVGSISREIMWMRRPNAGAQREAVRNAKH